MNGYRLAALVVGAMNEGLDAFLRGLKVRGFEKAVQSFTKTRLDGPEESGLLAGAVELFGTVTRLGGHLQAVALTSIESASKGNEEKPPSP